MRVLAWSTVLLLAGVMLGAACGGGDDDQAASDPVRSVTAAEVETILTVWEEAVPPNGRLIDRAALPSEIAERVAAFDQVATDPGVFLAYETFTGDVYVGDFYLWLTMNTAPVAFSEICEATDGWVAGKFWVIDCS